MYQERFIALTGGAFYQLSNLNPPTWTKFVTPKNPQNTFIIFEMPYYAVGYNV